jgi:hypothetical protein
MSFEDKEFSIKLPDTETGGVTMAMVGRNLVKVPSLSSASTTIQSPEPTRALVP